MRGFHRNKLPSSSARAINRAALPLFFLIPKIDSPFNRPKTKTTQHSQISTLTFRSNADRIPPKAYSFRQPETMSETTTQSQRFHWSMRIQWRTITSATETPKSWTSSNSKSRSSHLQSWCAKISNSDSPWRFQVPRSTSCTSEHHWPESIEQDVDESCWTSTATDCSRNL